METNSYNSGKVRVFVTRPPSTEPALFGGIRRQVLITTERFAENAISSLSLPNRPQWPLAVADIQCNGDAMYVHFTNTQVIIGGFALFLIIIFSLAAFLDKRWRTAGRLRDFGSDHKPNSLRQGSSRDDKDGSSKLYTRYADLSARGLGTAEQSITLRGEKQQNLAGD